MILYDDLKYGELQVNKLGVDYPESYNRLLATSIIDNILIDGNSNLRSTLFDFADSTQSEKIKTVESIFGNRLVVPTPPQAPTYHNNQISKEAWINNLQITLVDAYKNKVSLEAFVFIVPELSKQDFNNTYLGHFISENFSTYIDRYKEYISLRRSLVNMYEDYVYATMWLNDIDKSKLSNMKLEEIVKYIDNFLHLPNNEQVTAGRGGVRSVCKTNIRSTILFSISDRLYFEDRLKWLDKVINELGMEINRYVLRSNTSAFNSMQADFNEYLQIIANVDSNYNAHISEINNKNDEIKRDYNEKLAEYYRIIEDGKSQTNELVSSLQDTIDKYNTGDRDAIQRYCSYVLAYSDYHFQIPQYKNDLDISFNKVNGVLVVN